MDLSFFFFFFLMGVGLFCRESMPFLALGLGLNGLGLESACLIGQYVVRLRN